MGNRAIISTRKEYDNDTLGLYLHWNGGRDSVEGFLAYCDLCGHRSPETDGYGYARLAQVIGNFFGGTLSVGIVSNPRECASGCDNGAYIVENWKIVGREAWGENDIEQNEYDLLDVLQSVNAKQPEPLSDRLISAYALERICPISYEEKVELLNVGDEVIVRDWNGEYEVVYIEGFGKPGRVVNGHDVGGMPYHNKYNLGVANINNYLTEKSTFFIPNRPEHVKKVQRSLIDLI